MHLLHTLRHLKPRQITGQIHNRLRPFYERPSRFFLRSTPPFPGCHWEPFMKFHPPGEQSNGAASILAGNLMFLNQTRSLGFPPEWANPGHPLLWQYNLHYFEWLWALEYDAAREATLDWINHHPLRRQSVGWQPYPLSLRLMNWCGVFFDKFRRRTEADATFLAGFWRSLYLQAEWLRGHLEYHLMANHLLENAAALAFVGACFNEPRWLKVGQALLTRQIHEQILPDGMHFERSPMYHLRMTFLMASLLNSRHRALHLLAEKTLPRMLIPLARLRHPDGQIALFNDSALGIYGAPDQLLEYAKSLLQKDICGSMDSGAFALPQAGYYGWRDHKGNAIICDAGAAGPDYQPGHSHGDIFSFEMSLNGRRVIVDSGVCTYETGEMRDYCRSTRAHNTVEIDGHDQCEFWGAFRVARRGRPKNVRFEPADSGFLLSAWHDGYRRLPGEPVHARTFLVQPGPVFTITDHVTASRPVQAISRLHLHPACRIASADKSSTRIEYPGGTFVIRFGGQGRLTIEESFYCPEFNCPQPAKAVCYTATGQDLLLTTVLSVE